MDCVIVSGSDLLSGETKIPASSASRVILAGGCFDVLHIGHITYLQRSKDQGDYLVVALESDEFIRGHKHREPFHAQRQRSQVLSSIRYVDCVIELPPMESETTYRSLVHAVHPQIITITQGDSKAARKRTLARAVGAQVVTVNKLISELSSSTIMTYAHIVHD